MIIRPLKSISLQLTKLLSSRDPFPRKAKTLGVPGQDAYQRRWIFIGDAAPIGEPLHEEAF